MPILDRKLWPNFPVFPLPAWVLQLAPLSVPGHWITTAHCLQWQGTQLNGVEHGHLMYLQPIACISYRVHIFSHGCIHSLVYNLQLEERLYVSVIVQLSEDKLSKAHFLSYVGGVAGGGESHRHTTFKQCKIAVLALVLKACFYLIPSPAEVRIPFSFCGSAKGKNNNTNH